MGNKAVFLDRDGVINEDRGYVYRIEDFHFIDGVFSACQQLQKQNFKLIIVTNQSGIGRGYFTEQDFQQLNQWMLQRFAEQQINITAVYHCPYHPTAGLGNYRQDSPYRKPHPQMLLDAATEHQLDLSQCWMIGDSQSDMAAASNAGIPQRIYLGKANDYIMRHPDIRVYPDLISAVNQEFAINGL